MSREINVQITNRTAWLTSDFKAEELKPFWSYAVQNYQWIVRAKPWLAKTWDGRHHYLTGNQLPAGLFWATRKEIEDELNLKFIVKGELDRAELKAESESILTSDRDYQNDCIKAMLKTIRFGGGLVIGATGTGKTRMAGMLFSRLAYNTLFVVDQLILMEQAIEELTAALGEEIGRVGDKVFEPRRITVATRQTMYAHRGKPAFRKWTNTLDVVLIDEIHEQMNHSNFSVVEGIQPLAVFGLTATLQLKQKQTRLKAFSLCGPVVFSYPLLRGQQEGHLAQGIAVRVVYPNPVDYTEQKLLGWSKLYTERIVENVERNWLITELAKEAHDQGKYVIVLVSRVRHLKLLSDRLKDIPHRVVSGTFDGKNVKVEDRLQSKSQFEAGDIRLIIANTVFKKGVNLKRVDCIIDADAGRSENDAVQKYGRGIRQHEAKTGLLYYDLNDWDTENPKNWFHIASRYRTRALQRAGVEVHKFNWQEGRKVKELLQYGEAYLSDKLANQKGEQNVRTQNVS